MFATNSLNPSSKHGVMVYFLNLPYGKFSQLHLLDKLTNFPPPRILVSYRGFYDCAEGGAQIFLGEQTILIKTGGGER